MNHSAKLRNTIFAVAIVGLILSVFLYVYLYRQTGDLVTQTIDARKLAGAADATRTQGKDIMKLYQDTVEKRATLSKYFVPRENAVTFIKTVESIGQASGAAVTISAIKSSEPEKDAKDTMGRVTANVSVSGSWSDVMQALELFEALPYKNEIGRISMNSAGALDSKSPGVNRWQLGFEITVSSI